MSLIFHKSVLVVILAVNPEPVVAWAAGLLEYKHHRAWERRSY